MNTGMQNAFNLAWKLSLLVRRYGDTEAILDSYMLFLVGVRFIAMWIDLRQWR